MTQYQHELASVFGDTDSHMNVAHIITDHLTNTTDIRKVALDGLDLSHVKTILDLGCGFGFFTRGLSGRVDKNAKATGLDMHGKYEELYLKTCIETGIEGNFCPDGISAIEKWQGNSFDLIICSYALYYFPEYIDHIIRLLKKDGVFVTITHSRPHMKEFTAYVRKILNRNGINTNDRLPYEALIENFSNENVMSLLKPLFRNVEEKDYRSALLFPYQDFKSFEKYFRFKRSFFIPEFEDDEGELTELILSELEKDIKKEGQLKITKDDMIFICSGKI